MTSKPAYSSRLASASPTTARTDPDGRFSTRLRFRGEGRRPIDLSYGGSHLLGAASTTVWVEVGRSRVELTLDMRDPVAARRLADATLQATDAVGAAVAALPLEVRLDGRRLETTKTDTSGRAHVKLPALEPGAHQVVAVWVGDALRLPARVERRFWAASWMRWASLWTVRVPLSTSAAIPLTERRLRSWTGFRSSSNSSPA